MVLTHCVWHEASPTKQPFDLASLPLKHNVSHIGTEAITGKRLAERLFTFIVCFPFIQSSLSYFAVRYTQQKLIRVQVKIIICTFY